ncbi:6-bladed beta-propeller [Robiginitalea sp. SC105]|uniref:6-bladed beta-propeller n=1 Tax=Robiginitalea sp. SC105 TaxID=2762332 RepID=UPI0021057949|nr:6-bladed beta-propeller [Robiginitalea sp. SC105]
MKATSSNPDYRKQPTDTIIGHGDFRYRLHKDWGTQDLRNFPVRNCHEMVQDQQGRLLLLTNHPGNNMLIYDRSGKVLDTWTLNLTGAHGLTLSEEGGEEFLYITSTDEHRVIKTDLSGRVLKEFPFPQETGRYDAIDKYLPTETTVGPNGDIYIADGYGENLILQYTQKGELVRFWGGKGDTEDTFDCCHGVTLDTRDPTNPTLLVTSRSKQEFKRFSLEGNHLETISLPGCWICRPVIHGDQLYFAVIVTRTWGTYDGCLIVLDRDNRVISCPGGTAPEYASGSLIPPTYDDYSFLNPHDVCVDQDENLYVPQWASGRTYPVMLERIN